MKSIIYIIICISLIAGCKDKQVQDLVEDIQSTYKTTGSIERLDPRIDALISNDATIEVLAEGHTWSEGPLWIEDGKYLLYSDIPPNRIYKWSEEGGKELYLEPSGYTGETPRGGEPGSNGLLLDQQGRLVMCQHGDRRVARMTTPINQPTYITDPPYGLEGNVNDPAKEIDFQGVYRYNTSGELTLIADDIPRPNGIGLSLDESKLYVANSEGAPQWTVIDLSPEGEPSNQRVFHHDQDAQGDGAPDGLKIDNAGNIWATGPGGVWVFAPDGTVLGKIKTGEKTSNCAFNADKSILYMTCDDYLMRIKL